MKEKINQILRTIKEKVPFLGKFIKVAPQEGIDEEIEDVESEEVSEDSTNPAMVLDDQELEVDNSLLGKLKAKLPFLAKLIPAKKQASNVDSDEEEKPKKKLKPIHVVIVVLVIVFVLFTEEEQKPTEVPAPVAKEKTKGKKNVEAVVPDEVVTASVEETPSASVASPTEPAAVVDNSAIGQGADDASQGEIESSTPNLPNQNIPEIDLGSIANEAGTDLNKPTVGDDSSPVVDTPSQDQSNEKVSSEALKDLEHDIADKRQKRRQITPVDYVPAPDFEISGRGLVYSCRGKHWACVDGSSYGQCEKNYLYNKNKNDVIECYPDNVYKTDYDCVRAQVDKINGAVGTSFCTSTNGN